MKKFLLLILLSACTPAVTRAAVQATAYKASIDVTCFMYAVQTGDNPAAVKALHKRCVVVLTDAQGGGK